VRPKGKLTREISGTQVASQMGPRTRGRRSSHVSWDAKTWAIGDERRKARANAAEHAQRLPWVRGEARLRLIASKPGTGGQGKRKR